MAARRNSKGWAMEKFLAELEKIGANSVLKQLWSNCGMREEIGHSGRRVKRHEVDGKLIGFRVETKPSYKKKYSRCAYVTVPEGDVEPDDHTTATRRDHIRTGSATYIGNYEEWLIFNPNKHFYRHGASVKHKCFEQRHIMRGAQYHDTIHMCRLCWRRCDPVIPKQTEKTLALGHHQYCHFELERMQIPEIEWYIQHCEHCGTAVEGGLQMMAMLHFAEL